MLGFMISKSRNWIRVTASLVGLLTILPLSAELPSLNEKDFLGYFIAYQTKSAQFGLASDGKISIKVLDDKGSPVSSRLTVTINFKIEQTLPNGKIVNLKINPEALESTQPATMKPKNVTFKGTLENGVTFEVCASEERGALLLGGRLLNPSEVKNPTRFGIEVKFPNALPEIRGELSKKEIKAFEDKIKDDKVDIVRVDGKKVKIPGDKPVDPSAADFGGPGITSLSAEFSTYQKKEIQIIASPNSSMIFTSKETEPMQKGFVLKWSADLVKDPEGKARMAVMVK